MKIFGSEIRIGKLLLYLVGLVVIGYPVFRISEYLVFPVWIFFFCTFMENVMLLGFLVAAIFLVFFLFTREERRISQKQLQRAHQASAIKIANLNGGSISVASFALGSKLELPLCERILDELAQAGLFHSSTKPGLSPVYQLDPEIHRELPNELDEEQEDDAEEEYYDDRDENFEEEEDYDDEYEDFEDDVEDDELEDENEASANYFEGIDEMRYISFDEEEELEREFFYQKRMKKVIWITLAVMVLFLLIIDEAHLFRHLGVYLMAACTALIFFVLFGTHIWLMQRKEAERYSEHSILQYVMANVGELNPKAVPYYTGETLQSIEPILKRWHRNQYCALTQTEERQTLYLFPNYQLRSNYYFYDYQYNPIPPLLKRKTMMLLLCCFTFLFTFAGGYALTHWHSSIYVITCIVIGAYYGYIAISKKRAEAERIERIGLKVAEYKDGSLAVYELAYNALITMKEAAKVLEKWEQMNVARKKETDDNVPTYMISGVVPMEQRLRSEHV
ncbi:DNA primase [uncultured Brevibacillus sp.]|uniref:DNA primase n=1 Tax=uncultured Brevibacillus sp. TaxID=169970 RepID=UPI00259226DE|nr:DNA primase [uncultured Brevibacillus sp.]